MHANSALHPPAEKLETLRALDIFHQWESLDEKRLCRRCGETITGREIKIVLAPGGGDALRLECPTEGCPSVPIEWMMIDSPSTSEPARPTGRKLGPQPADAARRRLPGLFGFLRVPRVVF